MARNRTITLLKSYRKVKNEKKQELKKKKENHNSLDCSQTESYVNGEATLNENLADALGLKQAFFGYQQWKERHEVEPKLSGFTNLTHEQLFFLSYAVVRVRFITL